MVPVWKGQLGNIVHYTLLLEGETSDGGWRVLLCKDEDEVDDRITHKIPGFKDLEHTDDDKPVTCLRCLALEQTFDLWNEYYAWRDECLRRP